MATHAVGAHLACINQLPCLLQLLQHHAELCLLLLVSGSTTCSKRRQPITQSGQVGQGFGTQSSGILCKKQW